MILQQFINLFIISHWSSLVKFFSDYLIEAALGHARQHLLVKLHTRLDLSDLERQVTHYHHQNGPGCAVTHPTSRLLRALLVKYLYDLSLRETEERLHSDIIMRWFVGYSLFDPSPDHCSLERFELWVKTNQPAAIFDDVLRQIQVDFPAASKNPDWGQLRHARQCCPARPASADSCHLS